MTTFWDTFILGIALTLPLGPVTLEVIRRGVKGGIRNSMITAIGAFSAEIVYFSMVYMGLGKLSEIWFIKLGLGVFGVIFLLKLGWESIVEYKEGGMELEVELSQGGSYKAGFLITFLNPSNFYMWVGIIGRFFLETSLLSVNGGVLVGIGASLLFVAILSKVLRNYLKKQYMKYISLVAGVLMVYFAFKSFMVVVKMF